MLAKYLQSTMRCWSSLTTLVFGLFISNLALSSQDYAKTKHPIVMVPGAFAFDSVLGVVDYWYGITEDLRAQGAEVYVTNLSSSASNIVRGEELMEDVRRILALTGAQKVNLVAHSQGGPAARYVASLRPDWVESISCVTCMNEGTEFADNLYSFLNKRRPLKWLVNLTLSAVFSALEVLSTQSKDGVYNSPQRPYQIAEDLVIAAGTQSLREFNQRFPEALPDENCEMQAQGAVYNGKSGPSRVNQVSYYSWGGTDEFTNAVDPVDILLVPTVRAFFPKSRIWDGLVRSCGHPLGTLTEGYYPINHFDAINQTLGLNSGALDIPTLYLIQANRLQREGH